MSIYINKKVGKSENEGMYIELGNDEVIEIEIVQRNVRGIS